jgi:UPF0755 protein
MIIYFRINCWHNVCMLNADYKISEPKKSALKIALLILLLIGVVVLMLAIYFFTKINKGSADQSVPVNVTIEKGSSTKGIARTLTDASVIRDPNLFLVYTIFTNAAGKIQAGDYVLDRKMSIVEIVDVLTAGKVTRDEKKVTLIEGWNNAQIKKYLVSRNITTDAGFDAALLQPYEFQFSSEARSVEYEGYLYPDTYVINKDATFDDLVQKALSNFEEKITEQMLADIHEQGKTFKDIVVLASIIEKEVGRNTTEALTEDDLEAMQHERELVASVFYNRLEIGMALQSDATVNYVTGKSDRSARSEDLEVDSRYNTYRYAGLPPGPIGNPSINSIRAAIYPAQSDYLYFLHDPEGIPYFGKTLEEHNSNREKYLR